MHIKALRIQNFRRLKDVTIELDRDLSIFVGANNSGKTSTGHALQLFTAASKDKFTVHDFNIDSWNNIEVGGNIREATPPTISLDIWLQVNEENLHRIIELLPSLQWEGNYVGIRIKFSPIDIRSLLVRYQEAKAEARSNALTNEAGEITFQPQPKNLKEFLEQNLKKEYELKYYVLDHSKFNEEFNETEDYEPELISREKGKSGKELINSLIKVDFLHAQRHLSDNSEGNRSEELSKRLSRFYERNLEKLEDDYETIEALSTSESKLNDHLAKVFEPTLDSLSHLGYPGLSNPNLVIKSSLNPTTILSNNDGAKVYYSLDTEDDRCSHILPDRYNGLGYKNLIYMVIELLDIHTQWLDIEESRPALHLIFIEEPEAHLHVQLQQAFIRKVMDLLALDHSDTHLQTQLVVTTHSTHILYEKGFIPIRYFRRDLNNKETKVLNLSQFYNYFEEDEKPIRDFLQKYLKLTHCDLFFADAAVLVEGNVERLLLPQMIENSNPKLKSCYLTILEIGGAYGHKFKPLIDFLGLTTLIITDIDSVTGSVPSETSNEEEDEDEVNGTACLVETENAVTSNQMLIQWLPELNQISDLIQASNEQKTSENGYVRVAYQTPTNVSWNNSSKNITGRTLEVSFAIDNLAWCQSNAQKDIKLRIAKNDEKSLDVLIEKIHNRVKAKHFNKTEFALGLIMKDTDDWNVPTYIKEGLDWLESKIVIDLSERG